MKEWLLCVRCSKIREIREFESIDGNRQCECGCNVFMIFHLENTPRITYSDSDSYIIRGDNFIYRVSKDKKDDAATREKKMKILWE